jgi:2-dehydropantoate 2-reductase
MIMASIRNISILGAGALGAAYASQFFEVDPDSVSFIARGERYFRLKTHGVVVNDRHYQIPVVSPEEQAPPADLVIVALKHQHLQAALPDLKHQIGDQTLVISVMNGLDSEQRIGDLYGHGKMLYAISLGIDAVRERNRTAYSKTGKLIFGEADNTVLTERVKRIQALLARTGIPYETPTDMIRSLWWKFMINVGINQASAVLRAPYDVFQKSAEAKALMESAMREVLELAKAAQVNLHEDDVTDWYAILSTLSPQGKTSMLQDIEAGRKTEVEMFAGKVMELGQTYGIPTPVNQTLFYILRALEGTP